MTACMTFCVNTSELTPRSIVGFEDELRARLLTLMRGDNLSLIVTAIHDGHRCSFDGISNEMRAVLREESMSFLKSKLRGWVQRYQNKFKALITKSKRAEDDKLRFSLEGMAKEVGEARHVLTAAMHKLEKESP